MTTFPSPPRQHAIQQFVRSRRPWVRRGGWAAGIAVLSVALLTANARIALTRRSDTTGGVADPPRAATDAFPTKRIPTVEGTTDRHRPVDDARTISVNDVNVQAKGSNSTITFVCDMSAEMGNMLSNLAYCTSLAAHMWKEHKVRVDLVPRHLGRDGEGWESSREDIRACFPRLSQLDFFGARTPQFATELEERRTMQERSGFNLSGIDAPYQPADVAEAVLAQVARRVQRNGVTRFPNGTITLPFLVARGMVAYDHNDWLDRYFDDIRDMFEFDAADSNCCALKPHPDETVFHLRNFKAEVTQRFANWKGFKELGPRQTAYDLLGHLRPGDKVAILSRFSDDEVQRYVSAMKDRGLEVRLVEGQTSCQDFCFLMSATKEVVGISISTYFYWAARLSHARRIVTYSLDIPSQWRRKGRAYFQYNYTHPGLVGNQRQWVFRLFRPDESPNATLGQSVVVGGVTDASRP